MEQISSQEHLSRILRVFFISAGLVMCTGSLSAYSDTDRDTYLSSMKGKSLKKTNVVINNIFQQKTLTGTVRNAEGVPLEGVSVKIKGSSAATSTDAQGGYGLQSSGTDQTLVFSTVGYVTQELPISSTGITDVTLQSDVTSIGDVVVIGYGTQKKENLTGAVSTVTSEVLESRPITTLGQGLQGTAPNLNVTQSSGAPGKAATFNVRGNTSINGGGPLVLVNGIPMDPNLISPSDVESVTILKDAASAAIYGARAAYGVILITTKSGKNDKPVISLSTLFSTNTPTSKIDFIDTKDRIAYMNEASMRVNGRNYFDDITMEAMMAHYNDPSKPNSIIHPSSLDEWRGVANTNWEDVLMSKSYPMQQHTASITGGSEKFDYYSSFSFIKQNGLTNKDLFDEYYKRYNFMTNLNYHIKEWITVGTKVSINNGNKHFPPNDSQFRSSFPEDGTIYQTNVYSTQPVKDPNGNWAHEGSIFNPAQMLSEGGYQTRHVNDMWMTGLVKITPIKEITINVDYSFNNKTTKQMSYLAKQPFYNVKGDVMGYYGGSNPSRVSRSNYDDRYYVFNAYADYTKTFAEKHNFKVMVGFNQEHAQYNSVTAERRNLIINNVPYMNLASGDRFAYDGIDEYAIRGAFSRINYSYADRYLIEFNGRYDGTSKFAQRDRFAFFPSVSVGWRIDNEAFFEPLKSSINQLKFRASYGNLGNQNVTGYYPYIATMSAAEVNYLLNGDRPMSVYAPGLVSSTLTWETVTQKNFGVDFGLLNNRLNGSFDFYTRDTKDMLTKSQTLPAVIAETEPQANAADLRTTGFDLSINWNDKVGEFSYGITGILSDYYAEITRFNNPVGLISDYYVGAKMGNIWGLTTGGLFQTDQEALALDQSNINGRKRQAGDLWMVDINGDGKITRGTQTLGDPGDMSIIGNNTPRYSFGLRTNFAWKGFDMDIFFQGVGKRDLVISNLYYLTQYSNEWVGIPKTAMDYWSPENPNAFYPRPIIAGAADITTVQTRYLQNAAYLRLKQVTLGYTLPQELTQKISSDRIRVFFTGSNLFTWTKMIKISDPELPGPSAYPMFRSFSFGANFSF
ncbi:SusC/RagA family TonB-linked outer membrane protein [Sphingobacterium zhuxiongii]|nr:TonB-dependent receptor [Sphingobacterium sp. dk4302]